MLNDLLPETGLIRREYNGKYRYSISRYSPMNLFELFVVLHFTSKYASPLFSHEWGHSGP